MGGAFDSARALLNFVSTPPHSLSFDLRAGAFPFNSLKGPYFFGVYPLYRFENWQGDFFHLSMRTCLSPVRYILKRGILFFCS